MSGIDGLMKDNDDGFKCARHLKSKAKKKLNNIGNWLLHLLTFSGSLLCFEVINGRWCLLIICNKVYDACGVCRCLCVCVYYDYDYLYLYNKNRYSWYDDGDEEDDDDDVDGVDDNYEDNDDQISSEYTASPNACLVGCCYLSIFRCKKQTLEKKTPKHTNPIGMDHNNTNHKPKPLNIEIDVD